MGLSRQGVQCQTAKIGRCDLQRFLSDPGPDAALAPHRALRDMDPRSSAQRGAESAQSQRPRREDPSGARMAVRQSPTVAQLCDDYVADMQSGRINGKKA